MALGVGDIYAQLGLDTTSYDAAMVRSIVKVQDLNAEFDKFLRMGARRPYAQIEQAIPGTPVQEASRNLLTGQSALDKIKAGLQGAGGAADIFGSKMYGATRAINQALLYSDMLPPNIVRSVMMAERLAYVFGGLGFAMKAVVLPAAAGYGVGTLIRQINGADEAMQKFLVRVGANIEAPALSQIEAKMLAITAATRTARLEIEKGLRGDSPATEKENDAIMAGMSFLRERITGEDRLNILVGERSAKQQALAEEEKKLAEYRQRVTAPDSEESAIIAGQREKVAKARQEAIAAEREVWMEEQDQAAKSDQARFADIGRLKLPDRMTELGGMEEDIKLRLIPVMEELADPKIDSQRRMILAAEKELLETRLDAVSDVARATEDQMRKEEDARMEQIDGLLDRAAGIQRAMFWEDETAKEKAATTTFGFTDAAGFQRIAQQMSGKPEGKTVAERRAEEQRDMQLEELRKIEAKIGMIWI